MALGGVRAAQSVFVNETTQVGTARRASAFAARVLNFDETVLGKLAVVVTELGNNLVKHGGGGELMWQADVPHARMQVWALDRGRGMRNVAECMRDGYSTAGSPGTGLGAVARMALTFEVFSQPEGGTAIYAEVGADAPTPSGNTIGAVSVPRVGEELCGDAWTVLRDATWSRFMVVDGLGHGLHAAQAADAALEVWEENAHRVAPTEFLERANIALRSTRGAAIAVAFADPAKRVLHYAGVGNISGCIISSALSTRSMISSNGTVGMEMRRVQEFHYPYESGSLLVMHSDGLSTHWRVDRYPGLIQRHPGLVAGVLYRDHKRGRDDATVLVAKLDS